MAPPDTMPYEIWAHPDGRIALSIGLKGVDLSPIATLYIRADLATAREAALMACVAELAAANEWSTYEEMGLALKMACKKYAVIIAEAQAQAQTKGEKDV